MGGMLRRITLALLVTFLAAGSAAYAQKKAITPPGSKPSPNFSAGLMVGDTLYVSGMVGRAPDGKYPAKFEDEVQQTLDNINQVVKAAGMSMADAVAVQVYLTDMSMFDRMNSVYIKAFSDPKPTRTTVGVAKLVGEAKIEITVTLRKAK